MTAQVLPHGIAWRSWCDECQESGEVWDDDLDAAEEADEHNRARHEPRERDYSDERRAEREERMT